MSKFNKSFHLVIETFKLMKKDPEILIFPVLNCLIFFLFCLSIFYTYFHGNYDELDKIIEGIEDFKSGYYFLIIILYLFGYFSTYFFQAGLMFVVNARIHKKDLSFKDGATRALAKLPEIFLLSIIQSTAGIMLGWIFEKVSTLNKIIVALVGAAWSVATFFVLPVVILENNSFGKSFEESSKIFKKTWGETIIINFSTTAFFDVILRIFCFSCAFLLVFFDNLLGFLPPFSYFIIFCLFGIALIVFLRSAIDGAFKVVLYEYAKNSIIPENFDQEIVVSVLTPHFKFEEEQKK